MIVSVIIVLLTPPPSVPKVDAITGFITTVAGDASMDIDEYRSGDGGPAVSAGLHRPVTLAVDAPGNIFIVDGNVIRMVRMDY